MSMGNQKIDPLHGSLLKNMLLFSLPVVGTAFLQVLFGSVDTMVIGRFGSENAMASVGAGASLINLIIGACMSLGTGVSILAGQKIGQGDEKSLSQLLHSLLLSALLLGALVAMPVIFLAEALLRSQHCPEGLLGNAVLYFRIYFLSMPFMMAFTFFSAVMHARGDSFRPFLIEVGCGALNLVLNLIFVVVCGWNVAGVAVATVLSQLLSAGAVTICFLREQGTFRLDFQKLTLFRGFGPVFRIGWPAALDSVVMSLSGVVIQSVVNRFPDDMISGNTVAASVEGLMCVAFIGFSSASVVFVSQCAGAGDWKRVRRVQRVATWMALALGEIIGVAVYAASWPLTGLYSDVDAIRQAAQVRMLFMCLPYGLCGTMNVLTGCIRGLGDTRVPLVISVFCSCVFRIAWIYLWAVPKGTMQAVYVSYPMCWALATGLYVIAFSVLLRKKVTSAPRAA